MQPKTTREDWGSLLAKAPRAELEQALLRVVIGGLIAVAIVGVWVARGSLTSNEGHGLWFAVAFFGFGLLLLARILLSGADKLALGLVGRTLTAGADRSGIIRRLLGIVADNAAATYFMLVMGEGGAVIIGVYLFVTLGNGFRYGRAFLHISQVLSLVGFSIVLYCSSFWSQHLAVGAGMLLAMVVLPFYVAVLAQRITEAKKRADEANQAKGRFLANVSHEMRTPLNGVIAMIDLLRETALSESQREIVETMTTSANLALAQIEDVLDMAKIEAGRAHIEAHAFDLGNVLTDAVKLILPQARYKRLVVKTDIAPSAAAWFVGDAQHLRQVLLNLLSNAVKFTEEGQITVFAAVVANRDDVATVRIEVRDTGIGIAPENHGVIFEAFAQADDSVTRVYGGTGLGTTIAKQLVTLMGGRIGLESAVGVGSTFWFEVPLALTHQQHGENLADAPVVIHRLTATGTLLARGHGATIHKLRGARILVADDNPTNQRVTQLIIESGGHVPTVVSNGEEALDALEHGNFDIALLDLAMPVVSGLEALKLYRFTTCNPIPVLILTASVTPETIASCVSAGASEFIAKPVRASLLLDAIERNLTNAAERISVHADVRPEERPILTIIETPPLDPEVIADLARVSRDPTFVERLTVGFRSDCERLVHTIVDGLAARKYEAVKDAAHALKGGSGSVGAMQLVQFAVRLEKATHETMRLKATPWAEELTRLVERTLAALDAHIEARRKQQSTS